MAAAVAQARVSSPFRLSAQSLATAATRAAELAGRVANPVLEIRTENWGPAGLPLDVFAVANQPIELGGKREARAGVAAAERDLAAANLRLTDRQLSLRTAQLYVQALKTRGLLTALRSTRDGLSSLIASVHRRVEEGYSAESDLLRFEAEAARVDIDVARAGLELERSLSALSVVIGAPVRVTASQLVEPSVLMPPSAMLPDIVAAAIRNHPEVASADARVARAQQGGALERTRQVPDPMLTAGYKRTAGFNTAVVGVLISLPLFERNGAGVARAAGEEAAATAERDATARRLSEEAVALVDMARTLFERSARVELELLVPAEGLRNAARATFREGTTDVLKLIDAERVHAEVQRTALELRLDAMAAVLEARFALGEEPLP
jgi:cobalt-zinc-cadmium efflux system outer membrane protein